MEARIKDAIRAISEALERVETQQQALENELAGAAGLEQCTGFLRSARTSAERLLRRTKP